MSWETGELNATCSHSATLKLIIPISQKVHPRRTTMTETHYTVCMCAQVLLLLMSMIEVS